MQAQVGIAANPESPASKTQEQSQVRSADFRAGSAGLARRAFFSGAEALSAEGSTASSDETLRLVYEAIAVARARIRSSRKCQTFFHNEGVQKIDETHYSLQDLGPGPVAAQVEENWVMLNLNAQGSFMRPPRDYKGLPDAAQVRGFYILHELAHELSAYTHFMSDHSVFVRENISRHARNNELLLMSCY
jgi:hypothetical protein